jgi:hypothetical protein
LFFVVEFLKAIGSTGLTQTKHKAPSTKYKNKRAELELAEI